MHPALVTADPAARPIRCVTAKTWPAIEAALSPAARAFATACGFAPASGRHLVVPGADGAVESMLFAVADPAARDADPLAFGRLPELLPAGTWRFEPAPPAADLATLGVLLGLYRFGRYRRGDRPAVRLVVPAGVDAAAVSRTAAAIALARELVNTPANDLGPAELERAVRDTGDASGASVRTILGEELARDFPLIHAVGQGSVRAPRLIDLTWGDATHPKVTLVGKGVCFDTGGLDIKPASAMAIMKKDMGGAACALALASLVMQRRLPVRLRLLVPAVENAISGSAFRPGDIYRSRKGLTVEIGDTDAEGRLVLADALTLADAETPDLLIDFATLTGAARVALGPEIPPFYTDDDVLAAELARHAADVADPLWRLPLWRPYAAGLESRVADIGSVAGGGFAGSITAALFLARFVEAAAAWVHVDLYAWNVKARPGRPEGGEAQAVRAFEALLAARFGR